MTSYFFYFPLLPMSAPLVSDADLDTHVRCIVATGDLEYLTQKNIFLELRETFSLDKEHLHGVRRAKLVAAIEEELQRRVDVPDDVGKKRKAPRLLPNAKKHKVASGKGSESRLKRLKRVAAAAGVGHVHLRLGDLTVGKACRALADYLATRNVVTTEKELAGGRPLETLIKRLAAKRELDDLASDLVPPPPPTADIAATATGRVQRAAAARPPIVDVEESESEEEEEEEEDEPSIGEEDVPTVSSYTMEEEEEEESDFEPESENE
jgi:hypothetical protein